MTTVNIDDTYLTGQFHTFYRELVRQKHVLLNKEDALLVSGTEEKTDRAARNIDAIHFDLLGILEQQAVDAGRLGGEYGIRFYQEAQYVMAGLADEILLHTEWDGREAWKTHLLEFSLFGTHVAGERFFEGVDKLLKNRDSAYTGMAAVYHLALSLGFRGKYRDKDDGGRLDFYRRQLYTFIFNRNPDLQRDGKRLFPEANAYTLDQAPGKRFPHMRRWVGLIAAVVLLYLLVSHGLWKYLTNDMVSLVENFLK